MAMPEHLFDRWSEIAGRVGRARAGPALSRLRWHARCRSGGRRRRHVQPPDATGARSDFQPSSSARAVIVSGRRRERAAPVRAAAARPVLGAVRSGSGAGATICPARRSGSCRACAQASSPASATVRASAWKTSGMSVSVHTRGASRSQRRLAHDLLRQHAPALFPFVCTARLTGVGRVAQTDSGQGRGHPRRRSAPALALPSDLRR